jgi:AraC-like DNA-binding protein
MIDRLVDSETSLPPEVRRIELVARIRAFIDRHLGDPGLSPSTLAVAHHISVRQLHRVFQAEEASASATVRQHRLERCRRDLATGLDPVHEIAARWGFQDAAHFSRVFRATYGHSPVDYRHHQTRHGVPEQTSARHARLGTWHASSMVVAPTVNDRRIWPLAY